LNDFGIFVAFLTAGFLVFFGLLLALLGNLLSFGILLEFFKTRIFIPFLGNFGVLVIFFVDGPFDFFGLLVPFFGDLLCFSVFGLFDCFGLLVAGDLVFFGLFVAGDSLFPLPFKPRDTCAEDIKGCKKNKQNNINRNVIYVGKN
jgi:hypothetical protein